jgi:hypothetical protein
MPMKWEALIRSAIALVEAALGHLIPSEKLAAFRRLERLASEHAADIEAQIRHEERLRATGRNR